MVVQRQRPYPGKGFAATPMKCCGKGLMWLHLPALRRAQLLHLAGEGAETRGRQLHGVDRTAGVRQGKPIDKKPHKMLNNRAYLGELRHKVQ
jgi:hypothetical protein